ncbi:hypothetical protein AGOR_G00136470 [Albula goreensis]|uniref:Protein rolling stone n=1 Tax=Albula goreensis TaxID=1534307 RepID=A0A8T3D9F6_9TELE|nr:hypothetical protein AGOR_G00136470 [Albula goreensis]
MGSTWTQCWREEFSVKKLSFSLSNPELLLHPQWNISPFSWLLYRVFMLTYTLGWCLYSGLLFSSPKWLIFCTNLSYCTMGLYYMVAVCTLVWAYILIRRVCWVYQETSSTESTSGEDSSESSGFFPLPAPLAMFLQLQWVLYVLTGCLALTVSFLYWVIIYPMRPRPLSSFNINLHIINVVQALLEHILSATPVHLLHYLALLLVCALYFLFTIIYWLAGCTGPSGKPYIYIVLDYGEKPLFATLSVLCIAFLCLPFFHFLLWNLYLLRKHLGTRPNGSHLAVRREVWWWGRVGGRSVPTSASQLDSSISVFAVREGGATNQVPLVPTADQHQYHLIELLHLISCGR